MRGGRSVQDATRAPHERAGCDDVDLLRHVDAQNEAQYEEHGGRSAHNMTTVVHDRAESLHTTARAVQPLGNANTMNTSESTRMGPGARAKYAVLSSRVARTTDTIIPKVTVDAIRASSTFSQCLSHLHPSMEVVWLLRNGHYQARTCGFARVVHASNNFAARCTTLAGVLHADRFDLSALFESPLLDGMPQRSHCRDAVRTLWRSFDGVPGAQERSLLVYAVISRVFPNTPSWTIDRDMSQTPEEWWSASGQSVSKAVWKTSDSSRQRIWTLCKNAWGLLIDSLKTRGYTDQQAEKHAYITIDTVWNRALPWALDYLKRNTRRKRLRVDFDRMDSEVTLRAGQHALTGILQMRRKSAPVLVVAGVPFGVAPFNATMSS